MRIKPSGWLYRVVKEVGEDGFEYSIRNVLHGENGEVLQWSEEDLPFGRTRMELQEDLLKMLNALIYPEIDLTIPDDL